MHFTFFHSYSNALRGQIIGALRFFDLIDEKGAYKGDQLEELAVQKSVSSRKTILKPLLRSKYAEVMKLDLKRITPSQLDEAFTEYGISGDTKKKAKTFFIKAVQFADLDLSPRITRRMKSLTPRKKLTLVQPASPQLQNTANLSSDDSIMSKSLALKGGGTLTVVVKGNFLEFEDDFNKVRAILKLLQW